MTRNITTKSLIIFFALFSLFSFGLAVSNVQAATTQIDFNNEVMFAPNCFCDADVARYNLAPFCEDRNWCNDDTVTKSANLSSGRYKVKVNVAHLTASQQYESIIFTFNGANYTIPDLGGNADSTGTGVFEVGTFDLSGNVSFKGTHRYANTFTGLWYSDPYSRVGSGNAMESVEIASVILEDISVPPTCVISANPTTINQGGNSTLSWTSINATSMSIDHNIGNVAINGSRPVSPTQTTTYRATVTGPGGVSTCQTTVTVRTNPVPTCTMTASPTNINVGNSSTLSWSSSNATSAVIDHGIGSVSVDGSRSVSPTQTTTYRGTFTGSGGTVVCQATVTVVLPPPPSCASSISPASINPGGSATLSWLSTNTSSASINQGIGNVPTSGSRTVSPSQTTVYTITFTGPGGVTSCQETLIVNNTPPPQPPTCTMSANPTTIGVGGSSTLSWTSNNATSAVINNGVGSVPTNSFAVVAPNQTTTYTGTFTGPGGTAVCQATVTVTLVPAPTCTMSVAPGSIQAGNNATLTWTSTNTTSASINQGIGVVVLNGNRIVSPAQTTTYIGTFTGAGGVATCSATLNVTSVSGPAISIVKDDNDNHDDTQTIASGGTATFSIVVTNTGTSNLTNVIVTDPLTPNCARTSAQTLGMYPGLTFDPGETFSYTCTVSNVIASFVNTARVDADDIGSVVVVNDTDPTNVVVSGGGNTPTCSMSFSPANINVGDATTLSWSSANVTTVDIDNGIGSVPTSGSRQIFRTSNATYTGTFTGPGGVVTCQATITVGGGGGGGSNEPRITLSSNSFADNPSFIYLSQIPYTGIPEMLISAFGYLFRFFAFGGLLYALYKVK
ncbi:hypothetical protein A3I18_02770 [Candidatus Campbellbacteria bacterium RIFCSPLOWO2_02_FULL_35_11]|uniref:DUF7507 domain-containing protein n=1 Tax=Candidatus Campbellbacteria bacterium RIFCSPLOWO2_02_FULL_35_11 TaxID=1797581 RepID=A0A1F5ESL5_9BACT|nr:MAG: hypothetical protein A3I18_02770 [Candidatus Campbellbacteria bacterium RIFCSPLOWO2_02_FULL_35_11]